MVLELNQRKENQLINFNEQIAKIFNKSEAKMKKAEVAKKKLESLNQPYESDSIELWRYISVSTNHFQYFKAT